MAWVYQADVYCDTCGPAIVKDLVLGRLKGEPASRAANGNAVRGRFPVPQVTVDVDGQDVNVSLTWEETERESDVFPCPGETDDNHEATDTPQHCASGEDCPDAERLDNGRSIGAPIGTELTTDGRKWLVGQFQETSGMPRRSHSVAVNKHWHERFSDSCPDLPCYHCGRAKILVRVRQSGDAIMPDGRCVAYGTPGSEPQCVVTTPCETCAETDQTIEGSSWEDVGNGESYTILSGEESDVVQRLLDDGYDAMSEG